MEERDAGKPTMQGRVEKEDAYLGGIRTRGKRGCGAAGKTPFVAVGETSLDCKPTRLKLQLVKGFRKAEMAKLAQSSFAWRFNRRFQPDTMTERLTWAALHAKPRPYRVVIAGWG